MENFPGFLGCFPLRLLLLLCTFIVEGLIGITRVLNPKYKHGFIKLRKYDSIVYLTFKLSTSFGHV